MLGLTTNLRFLRWVVREPAVRDGLVRTDTLDRIWPPDDLAARTAIPDEAWGAAAALLADAERTATDGWRLNGAGAAGAGQRRGAPVRGPGPRAAAEAVARRSTSSTSTSTAGACRSRSRRRRMSTARHAPPLGHHGAGPVDLVAPMPGRVIAVHVPAGRSGRGRRAGRDPRGDEDGARRRRAGATARSRT